MVTTWNLHEAYTDVYDLPRTKNSDQIIKILRGILTGSDKIITQNIFLQRWSRWFSLLDCWKETINHIFGYSFFENSFSGFISQSWLIMKDCLPADFFQTWDRQPYFKYFVSPGIRFDVRHTAKHEHTTSLKNNRHQ